MAVKVRRRIPLNLAVYEAVNFRDFNVNKAMESPPRTSAMKFTIFAKFPTLCEESRTHIPFNCVIPRVCPQMGT